MKINLESLEIRYIRNCILISTINFIFNILVAQKIQHVLQCIHVDYYFE